MGEGGSSLPALKGSGVGFSLLLLYKIHIDLSKALARVH
jgi:hypothetical protein